MIIKQVPIGSIDFGDESLRISEDLDLDRMCASLQAVGLIHPVVLMDPGAGAGLKIVCGFRRLHGLRRLEIAEAAARIIPSPASGLDAFLIALWENVAHRHLNALETARVLHKLKHACGVSNAMLIDRFLPMLGLPAHDSSLQAYLNLHLLHPELRRLLSAGHITLAATERLGRTTSEAQAAAAALLGKIRLSASLQRAVLDIAEDLAVIAKIGLAEIFAGPEIASIASDGGLSPFQKGEKIHALLYQRRNPRITRARSNYHAAKSALNLPGAIRISPDPYFESPGLRVEFDVSSAQGFRQAVQSLEGVCGAGPLDRLFDIS